MLWQAPPWPNTMARLLDDHAIRSDLAALPSASNLIPTEKVRSKLFLRTFLPSGLPFYAFWLARQADSLPICLPERPCFAGKSPFARLRPHTWRGTTGPTAFAGRLPC
jgi:hypothetical protein